MFKHLRSSNLLPRLQPNQPPLSTWSDWNNPFSSWTIMKNLSRHDFLKLSTNSLLALSRLLGIGGLIRYLGYQFDPTPPTEFDIGPATRYPKNSLTCSHLGCAVEERNFGFECPCHSSRYDLDGVVLRGPATDNLRKLRVEKSEDGTLHIFTT